MFFDSVDQRTLQHATVDSFVEKLLFPQEKARQNLKRYVHCLTKGESGSDVCMYNSQFHQAMGHEDEVYTLEWELEACIQHLIPHTRTIDIEFHVDKTLYRPALEGKPTFVIFHPNAASALEIYSNYSRVLDRSYGILALEYPGYNGRLFAQHDFIIKEAVLALESLFRQKIDSNHIVLCGHSIGTSIAINVAKHFSEKSFGALLLDCPFVDWQNLTKDYLSNNGYKYFSPLATLAGNTVINDNIIKFLDNIHNIKDIHQETPIIIFSANNDDVISPLQHQECFKVSQIDHQGTFLQGDIGHASLHKRSAFMQQVQQALVPYIS